MVSYINSEIGDYIMAVKTKKKTTTIHEIRKALNADQSPGWDGHEEWTDIQFKMKFYESMQYYSLQIAQKDVKSIIIQWMNSYGVEQDIINQFRKVKDWRCNTTLSGVASCIMKGMPTDRTGVLSIQNTDEWLLGRIYQIIEDSKEDLVEVVEDNPHKKAATKIDRNEEITNNAISELDAIIDGFYKNLDKFDPKLIKYDSVLSGIGVKPQHIDAIKEVYLPNISELKSVIDKECDEQLKEAYHDYSAKTLRKLYDSYMDLMRACDKVVTDSIKVKVKKPISNEKLVEKLKYKQEDDRFGITSIQPTTILGASELFCYDTRTRKLYKFIAADKSGLTVSGNCIANFNEKLSIGKTLKNPTEQLTLFKKAGKMAISSFLDNIDTMGIRANGKLTENQILLKTQ